MPDNNNDLICRLERKVGNSHRLDVDYALALYRCGDLLALGGLAEKFTLSKFGPAVFYALNRHIHYTNVCRFRCRFCRFSRPVGVADSYVLTPVQLAQQARDAQAAGATELHLVGGVHPDLPFDYYLEILSAVRQLCPALHLKAFTAVEIIDLAQKAQRDIESTLRILIEAGLASLPGGGAEILNDDYFRKYCPSKPGPDQWLDVHRTAHRLGLNSTATMLFGFEETIADRVNHLLRLRDLQDESVKLGKGRFLAFVPLPYVPDAPARSEAGDSGAAAPSVNDELMTIAISRLFLDNFAHIKAFWPMLGINTAQIALSFGANDLDGTVQQYHIVEKSGENAADCLSVDQIKRLITETGRTPLQCDPGYQPV